VASAKRKNLFLIFYCFKDNRNKGGKGIYTKYLCKKCDKKNGLKQKEKSRRRKRQFLWEYKKSHPCVDCGESNPICLQFDHVSDIKFMNVGILANGGHSLLLLKKEIEKCVIRCASCHMKKTAKDQNWYEAELRIEGCSIDEWNQKFSKAVLK
jgi:hypothetical protein